MTTLKSEDGTQIPGESGSEDVKEQPSPKLSTTSVARRDFLKTSVLASGGIFVAYGCLPMEELVSARLDIYLNGGALKALREKQTLSQKLEENT